MKSLILILSLLVSGSAFAMNENSSWAQILGNDNYIVDTPSVVFDNGSFHTTVFNVCVEGDLLRTKKMTRGQCLKWAGRGECLSYDRTFRYTPIMGQVNVCKEYRQVGRDEECVRWGSKTVSNPLAYTLDVFHGHGRDKDIKGRLAFSKDYDIPSCR